MLSPALVLILSQRKLVTTVIAGRGEEGGSGGELGVPADITGSCAKVSGNVTPDLARSTTNDSSADSGLWP